MEYVLFGSMERQFMKIAFLSHLDLNLYLFRLPIMIELIKKGHIVYALCPRGEKFDLFEHHGVKAISYDISRKSLNPFAALKTVKNIFDTIKLLDLDILHNFTVKPNIYGSIAGRCAKVPRIFNSVTGMGSFYIQTTKKAVIVRSAIELLYKIVNKFVTGVVFQNSDDMQYYINKKVVPKEKAILIKSSGINSLIYDIDKVNKKAMQNLKNELNINGQIVVLMVARAIWDKGIREYYEACEMLSEKYDDVKFLFVGL